MRTSGSVLAFCCGDQGPETNNLPVQGPTLARCFRASYVGSLDPLLRARDGNNHGKSDWETGAGNLMRTKKQKEDRKGARGQ